MKNILRLCMVLCGSMGVAAAWAQLPPQLCTQGRLINGTNLYHGAATMVFSIYRHANPAIAPTPRMAVTTTVAVVDGMYTALIGYTNRTVDWAWVREDNSSSGGDGWWLETKVNGVVLAPRERLLCVPYAMLAGTVTNGAIQSEHVSAGAVRNHHIAASGLALTNLGQNGAAVNQVIKWNGAAWVPANESGGGTSLWTAAGAHVYRAAGNVGIGSTSPFFPLHVRGATSLGAMFEAAGGAANVYLSSTSGTSAVEFQQNGAFRGSVGYNHAGSYLFLYEDGNVVVQNGRLGLGTVAPSATVHVASGNMLLGTGRLGIGTNSPGYRLHVAGNASGAAGAAAMLENVHTSGIALMARTTSSDAAAILDQHGSGNFLNCDAWDGATNWRRVIQLQKDGTVECKVLNITGGSDLSEGFRVEPGRIICPGMVMAIDPEHPGQLRVADQPYDRCVAGIVSGAGGINPGVRMGQAGTVAVGECPLALAGRAYCLVDASHGAIRPGDLLTTSPTPGHAMKAGDPARTPGAVLGKAMSALETGQGQVLVLISLQ